MQALELELAQLTDNGRARDHNEDAVLAMPLSGTEAQRLDVSAVAVVADGMGGHQGGEIASEAAINAVRENILNPLALERFPSAAAAAEDTVKRANVAVFGLGDSASARRPGTTMTMVLAGASRYAVAHVGDSRAYLITPSGVKQITDDDSEVAEAVRSGYMTEEAAKVSPFRNRLTRNVGLFRDVSPSIYTGTWQEGDAILLCSDGLSEYIEGPEMATTIRSSGSLEAACAQMVRMANERGGHDNISVVIARNGAELAAVTSENQQVAAKTSEGVVRKAPLDDPLPDPNRNLKVVLGVVMVILAVIAGAYAKRLTQAPNPPPVNNHVLRPKTHSTAGPTNVVATPFNPGPANTTQGNPGPVNTSPPDLGAVGSTSGNPPPSSKTTIHAVLDSESGTLTVQAAGFTPQLGRSRDKVDQQDDGFMLHFADAKQTSKLLSKGAQFEFRALDGTAVVILNQQGVSGDATLEKGASYDIDFINGDAVATVASFTVPK